MLHRWNSRSPPAVDRAEDCLSFFQAQGGGRSRHGCGTGLNLGLRELRAIRNHMAKLSATEAELVVQTAFAFFRSELPVGTKELSNRVWLVVGSGGSRCGWLLLIFVPLLLLVVLLGTARLLIAGTVVGSRRLIGRSGIGIGSRGFLVPIDLRLVLPIALIKSSDKVLQCLQGGGFSNAGDLVLQLIQEIFVKLAGERLLVPTGLPSVAVKVDSIPCCLSRVP